MSDEQNCVEEHKKPNKSSPRKKKILTGILWLLFSTSFIAMLFSGIVSMRLFLALCIGIWVLAKYWRKKFEAVMFPKSFTGKVKASKFYQLYFVTAMKQQWSAALLLLNVFPLVLMSVHLLDFINPVLDLDEMTKYKGIVVGVHRAPGNSSGLDYLWVKTAKGSTIKLVNLLGKGDYDYLKKLTELDEITVWVQREWSLPPAMHSQRVWQLKHDNHFTKRYNRDRVERFNVIGKIIFCASFLWILFSLLIIKKKYKTQKQEG
ncbi:MAG: hypothetical protein GY699_04950 [Desulfobacteraceae bacterium]|nr:hypothetical protein [Desulfobacteraceae bacterium]